MDEKTTLLNTMNENKLHGEVLESLIVETKSELRDIIRSIDEDTERFGDEFETLKYIKEKVKDCLSKLEEEV